MRAGNYVVDAPVYPHARRTHERMQSLQSRLATHPSYDHKGDGESLPTIEQQSFELARLVLKHYARFLGLPRRPLRVGRLLGPGRRRPHPGGPRHRG